MRDQSTFIIALAVRVPPRGQDRQDPVRVRAADAGGQGQEELTESGHQSISVYVLTIHPSGPAISASMEINLCVDCDTDTNQPVLCQWFPNSSCYNGK